MKQLRYTIILHPTEPDEEPGYWVEVPSLPGCYTQGQTIEECLAMATDAVECHLAGLREVGLPIPDEDVADGSVTASVAVPAEAA